MWYGPDSWEDEGMRTEGGPGMTIGGVATGALVDMVTASRRVLGIHLGCVLPTAISE